MPGHVHPCRFPGEFTNSGSTGVQESYQRVLRRLSLWLSVSGGLCGASGASHEGGTRWRCSDCRADGWSDPSPPHVDETAISSMTPAARSERRSHRSGVSTARRSEHRRQQFQVFTRCARIVYSGQPGEARCPSGFCLRQSDEPVSLPTALLVGPGVYSREDSTCRPVRVPTPSLALLPWALRPLRLKR